MTLPVSIAEKLQQMLLQKISFPASALKNTVVEKMLQDGVLQKRMSGKSRAVIYIPGHQALESYLSNHFGVNNLAKYSACSLAVISIKKENKNIVTIIKDNGKGFNARIINSGNGLKNMRERADAIKGKLMIETSEGTGTMVTLFIPV